MLNSFKRMTCWYIVLKLGVTTKHLFWPSFNMEYVKTGSLCAIQSNHAHFSLDIRYIYIYIYICMYIYISICPVSFFFFPTMLLSIPFFTIHVTLWKSFLCFIFLFLFLILSFFMGVNWLNGYNFVVVEQMRRGEVGENI